MPNCKLFCIPYAGGSAAEYQDWQLLMKSDAVEAVPVELAGRGVRARVPLCSTMDEAVADIYEMIQAQIDGQPYALFGHSMGAIIAFEVSRMLSKQNVMPSPVHLFVAGRNPPHVPRRADAKVLHELDDEAFIEEIIQFGGIPEELIAHRGLFRMFMPMLRKDYTVSERYQFQSDDSKLRCPISVLYGTLDHSTAEVMSQWQRYTSGSCSLQAYEAGHFFIHDYREQVVGWIESELAGTLTASVGRS
ncbi:thioesterase II family protein [Paenibacillus kobensis]|uniref:thioesterase II family protein n=1 Tax=Paenibacillus kobensis TaxID=59841 RepID=UPI0013E2C134|nr:alpha/beta fold hydrolase [Paenibacillus kobensis]